MKKPKKIRIKEARDGDRAMWKIANVAVFLVGLLILPKKLDTVAQFCEGLGQISAAAAAIFVVAALVTEVRATKMATRGLTAATLAVIFWQGPSFFNNFEEGWKTNSAKSLVSPITAILMIALAFWLYIRFLKTKS